MTFLWGTYTVRLHRAELGERLRFDCLSWQSLAGLWCVFDYWKTKLLVSVGMGRGEGLWNLMCLLWPWSTKSTAQQPICSVCIVCVRPLGGAGVCAALGMVPRASHMLTKPLLLSSTPQLPMDWVPFHCPSWSWNSSHSSNRLTSHDPPASASQVAGIKGLHYQV